MEIFSHSLIHALEEVLKMMPILFLAYLLVSYLSHDHNHKFSGFLSKKKKTSVLYASFLGCIPQCGFSSVIADLYSRQKVTLGTLIAVFVATSDEAIPIMIATPNQILNMLLLIGIKIVLALLWGYGIDFVVEIFSKIYKKHKRNKAQREIQSEKASEKTLQVLNKENEQNAGRILEVSLKASGEGVANTAQVEEEHSHHHHIHECGHIHSDTCDEHCHHDEQCCVDNIFLDAFKHTLEIAIYIFIATFIINILIEYFTLDIFTTILTDNAVVQILIACVLGLIPNCASSVLLVELFTLGALSFPALVAGLSTGAGVGLVMLFTRNRNVLKNLGILVLQLCIGIISGLLVLGFYRLV